MYKSINPVRHIFIKTVLLAVLLAALCATAYIVLALFSYITNINVIYAELFSFELCGIISVVLFVKWTEQQSVETFIKFNLRDSFMRKYVSGLIEGSIANIVCIGLIAMLAFNSFLWQSHFSAKTLAEVLLLAVFFAIQGASEEFLLRGYLLNALASRYNIIFSVAINAVIFAAFHMFLPGACVLSFLNIAIAGIWFSIIMLRTNSLVPSCAAHAAWNFIMGACFGMKLSGIDIPIKISRLSFKGSTIITGGGFGLEGSCITTAVLLLFIAANMLLIHYKKRYKK